VAYGREKAYVERLLDAFEAKHRDCRVVRMRPTLLFQRRAASEQRRIFAGPFVPSFVARPGLLPVLPWPRSLQFQALHTDDAAAALQLACFADARGAFNLAAEPVITGEIAADVLRSRFVPVPDALACRTLELLWGLHLAPAPPPMLDLILQLPLLDTTRARTELDWTPQRTSVDAFREMVLGVEEGAGGATPPLVPDSAAERLQEIATGVGER
jgi:nucleoside-diphosphate-sugar epimerase